MLEEIYPNELIDPIQLTPSAINNQLATHRPSLEAVLTQQRRLPSFSLLLGLCEDELPLVLDLTDPRCGAFLIAGDNGFDNTTLMHSLLTAAFKANRETEVSLHLISPHADDLLYFHRQPSFKISYEPYRPEIEVVLEEMVNLVSSRRNSGQITPVHLFAIDGLDLLWQALGPQARLRLDWLIEHGPAAGLWVIASIESSYVSKNIHSTLNLFPSRILGRISQPNLARYLSGLSRSYLSDLAPGVQYFVRTGGHSFKIWMLQSEDISD
jgi:hypothetical protein